MLGVGYPFLFSNLKERIEISDRIINFHNLYAALKHRFSLLEYFDNRIKKRKYGESVNMFDINKCCIEYNNNLILMGILAKWHNATAIFATQPFVGLKNNLTKNESKFMADDEMRKWRFFYQRLINVAEDAAKKTGAYYMPSYDIFAGNKDDIL
jgi:hypothetical protein